MGAQPVAARQIRTNAMDQETLDVPQTPQPDVTDACGCTPHMPTQGGSLAADSDPPGATAPTTEIRPAPKHRGGPLKLVVTLTPAEAGQYRAALAHRRRRVRSASPLDDGVGTVGRARSGADRSSRRQRRHWRLHPRNPTTARAPSHSHVPKGIASNSAPPARWLAEPPQETPSDVPAEGEPASLPATERVAAPTRPTGGQLTLVRLIELEASHATSVRLRRP